jgi:hypothetical protein
MWLMRWMRRRLASGPSRRSRAVEDAGVIGMAAARGAGAAVEGDHQRGAGDELFHEALEDDVAGDFGKQEVEVARGPDFGAARGRPTLAKKLGFVAEPLT